MTKWSLKALALLRDLYERHCNGYLTARVGHHTEFAVADSKLYVCSTAPRWIHRAHPGVV